MTDPAIDDLIERIIGCGIEVHRTLGPGLLESVYRECLLIELRAAQLPVVTEQPVPLRYRDVSIDSRLRLDLLVGNTIVVELTAVETLHPVCISQVITYLKLTNCPAGLIMNFNVSLLKNGIRRVDHPDRYVKKHKPWVNVRKEDIRPD